MSSFGSSKAILLKRNQCDSTGPVPFAKIFLFSSDPNHLLIPRCLALSWRGVSRSSRTLGAGCGGCGSCRRRTARDADGEVVWS
jgi:hypothetical protein